MPVANLIISTVEQNPLAEIEGLEEIGRLTLSDWLWAAGLVSGAILLAWIAYRVVHRVVAVPAAPLVARLVARFAAAVVFAVGFVYAMQQVGVSIAPLLGLIGLFGLALAFAFQDVLENFIAGVFLSIRRPFSEGDEIATDEHVGVVEDVQLRALTLRTFDGVRVYVPNSSVWTNPIVNYTALGTRRTTLEIGVAYDADLAAVQRLLEDATLRVDDVASEPAPQAYVYEFGASSINFALRFWHDPSIADQWRTRDAVAKAVKSILDDAGVEIPFPQRVVEIVGGQTVAADGG